MKGNLLRQLTLYKKVLQNQIKFSVPDKICKTALELGAIYRELTKFDDALGLYKSIKKIVQRFSSVLGYTFTIKYGNYIQKQATS